MQTLEVEQRVCEDHGAEWNISSTEADKTSYRNGY